MDDQEKRRRESKDWSAFVDAGISPRTGWWDRERHTLGWIVPTGYIYAKIWPGRAVVYFCSDETAYTSRICDGDLADAVKAVAKLIDAIKGKQ